MDEVEQQPTQPVFSTAFPSRPDTDLVLRSADDVHFAVHKLVLTLASPVFADMFVIANESQTEPVSLIEPAIHLEALLKIVYPIENPSFQSLHDLLEVYRAAHKYGVDSAFAWLKAELVSETKGFHPDIHSLLSKDPLYCYAFARQHDMKDLMLLAQTIWIDQEKQQPSLSPNPVVDTMPYGWYRELWEQRVSRSKWLLSHSWYMQDIIGDPEVGKVREIQFDEEHDDRVGELRQKASKYPSLQSIHKLKAEAFGFDKEECWVVNDFLSTSVEKETPLEVDPGFLTVTDLNPIDEESYKADLEAHLLNLARDGAQALIAQIFSLPTTPSPDGPLAQLPPPTTQLPRAKPLPKPKPPTKWERFAAAKGIQKKVRDKRVWDEEKQDWVNRWGKDGKNKQKEEQWINEVPMNAAVDFDPVKDARDSRKARVAKNQRQQLQNMARAQGAASTLEERKKELERTMATTRVSTASMGRFDKKLEGEKKLKGVKRKFDPAEASATDERKNSLALLSKMESDSKKTRPRAAAPSL
ncbi:hypothetical protein ONZ45_g15343 [Pleurotus djamor]|nr:hypothetical protein ONZ45_g15343 [Pleurotus djamor]